MDRIFKDEKEKGFVCRQCAIFLDANELKDGMCPECGQDEDLFMNENEEE